MNNTHKNKKNHITYDLVIIGGGLAGLYTLYKLSKTFSHLKILLLESGQRYGGRIYSYKETIDGQDYIMDLGAGRLGHHQPLINDLINELGLKPKIVDIPNTKTYIEVAENGKVHNKTHFKDYIMGKLTKFFFSPLITKLGKSMLQKYYLCELIKKYVSVSFSQKVASVFEYSSDLNEFNAYDAIEYFKHDYNSETKFFTLNGGLEQIIDHLIIAIKKTWAYKHNNIRIKNLSTVENITNKNTNNNLFKIEVNNYRTAKIYNIYSKYVVCAVPKKTLEKLELFKPILRDLNSINSINLLRIYEIYNKTNGETWFKNVEKTITNSQVQFVIPINPNNGLIMSSYSDCANANYWNLLLAKRGLEFVKAKLNTKLNQIFSIYNISVPQSKYIKMYFWDAGVACWKKNVDSDYISSKLLNPHSNVFIIGENYSKYQAWCEGALMTSDNCITKLVPLLMTNNTATRKKGGKKIKQIKIKQIKIKQYNNLTLEEVKKHNKKKDAWTIIENKVYNITSWIPKHPGGEIIMQALGKDATQLFIANNHPSYVKKTILPKYYIGTLKN